MVEPGTSANLSTTRKAVGRGTWLLAASWLRTYPKAWLPRDLAAGLTLAAYVLPSALGDASLAGLPPEAGLYACMFSGLVFWLFCSSRHTAVSVTSAISLLIGSSLGALAGGDATRFGALASCTALIAGLMALMAWLCNAGSIVNFISETVLVGFKAGVALHLASTQLPKLFGIHAAHGDFWERMGDFFRHVGETNVASLILGLASLLVLVAGKRLLPNKPVSLFVVVAGIVTASFVDLAGHGVKLLGDIPPGLPKLALPQVSFDEVRDLLPLALACFLLAAVETAAIGRMFAEKHGYRLDSNQELLAVAGGNLASALGHGFPTSGGMSQSLVNEGSGARSPLSGLISSLLLLLITLFFSSTLRNLPQPVLAAVVLMAVTGLVKVEELKRLWRFHRADFLVAFTALLGVLWLGLLQGVLLGAVLSLVMLIRRASTPHVAFLGRIPGARRYSDLERHPDNEPIPGLLAFRVESSIVYFNAEHVFDAVAAKVHAAPEPVQMVICDLSTSPMLDTAGARMFVSLHSDLANCGIVFRLVEARSAVRDMLRLEGVEEKAGRIDRLTTLADAVDDFNAHRSAKPPP